MAKPSRSVGSPEPAIVFNPETKSTSSLSGISKGCHASWVGDMWMRGFKGRKFASVSLLSGSSVCDRCQRQHAERRARETYESLVGDSGPDTV